MIVPPLLLLAGQKPSLFRSILGRSFGCRTNLDAPVFPSAFTCQQRPGPAISHGRTSPLVFFCNIRCSRTPLSMFAVLCCVFAWTPRPCSFTRVSGLVARWTRLRGRRWEVDTRYKLFHTTASPHNLFGTWSKKEQIFVQVSLEGCHHRTTGIRSITCETREHCWHLWGSVGQAPYQRYSRPFVSIIVASKALAQEEQGPFTQRKGKSSLSHGVHHAIISFVLGFIPYQAYRMRVASSQIWGWLRARICICSGREEGGRLQSVKICLMEREKERKTETRGERPPMIFRNR